MNSRLSIPARVTVFAVLTLLVIAAALTLPKSSPVAVFAQSSPPGAPTGLMATAVGLTTVELSWTAPVAGRDSVTGYRIEHSTDNGGTWAAAGSVANTEADGTPNAGVSGVQTYYSTTAVAIAGDVVSNLYRVSAIAGTVTGDPSARVSVTLPVAGAQPGAPTGVAATANGSMEINLSWTAPTAAGSSSITGYKIEYSKNNLLPWMEVGTTTVTTDDDGTEYSDTGLDPATTRYYRVSAMSIVGRGPVSSTSEADNPHMAATTLAGVPGAPTGLMATAVAVAAGGTDAVELSWTAPNQGSAPITGYRIESSSDDGATWSDTTPNGVPNTEAAGADNAAASGVQTFYAVEAAAGENLYRVSAMNIIGMGPVSATASATPPVAGAQPGAPANLQAVADGSSEIELTWEASAAGATSTTGYKIEYSKDGSLPWMNLATVGNVLAYNNTGLAPGTERHYRVSAMNSIGRGPISSVATATTESSPATSVPGRPTGLRATAVGVAGANAVELSWTAPGAGRDSITGYEIETSVNNGGTWTESVANTEGSGAQNEAASGVQTYYSVTAAAGMNQYRVLAINSVGTGDPSAVASVTPPVATAQPGAPTGVAATANGSTEINLSWTAPADTPAGPITSYRIEYSKDGNLPWMDAGTTTVTTSDDGTMYSDTGLAPATTRYYRVSAMNIAGRGPVSAVTPGTGPMAMTTLAGVPAAPSGLMATAVGVAGTDVIELSWTAPNEGRAPITGYRIETSGDDGETWTESVADTEASGADNEGAGVQTHYAVDAVAGKNLYRVSAMNAIGMGPVSDSASVTPPVADQQPAAPTAVTARPDGSSEIEVRWTAGAAGAGAITGYKIEYSKDNSLPWMEVATTTTSATMYDDTGLDPETTRYYRVSAINVVGRGPVSATTITDGTLPNAAADDHVAQTAMGPADQMGMVTLSTQEPMVGTAITAMLTDDDGMVSDQEWQWQKSMTPTNMNSWMDAMGMGAMTSSYTPQMADEGYSLRATVTYTDANRSGRIAESMATDAVMLPTDRMGTVTLSTQDPIVGIAVTATLMDADGMVSGEDWQWEKSMDKSSWMDATGMGAMTATYTPDAMDEGYYLRAMVTYDDKYRSDRMAESMATGSMVTSNRAPAFDMDDTTRAVEENSAAGTNVGDPVTAMDPDGDTLTYMLSGDDAMYFDIDAMGQITVGADTMLDYETKMSYMVTVTATDPDGESDSIAVTINVADVDENPLLTKWDTDPMNGVIDRNEAIAALRSYLADEIERSEAIAVLRLYLGN